MSTLMIILWQKNEQSKSFFARQSNDLSMLMIIFWQKNEQPHLFSAKQSNEYPNDYFLADE